jgi:hypothetical protein
MTEDLRCLEAGRGDCFGPVELRTTPDRSDGKHFPRCEAHFDARLASSARTLELLSPSPAPWFDPSYAGERWDEDE